ncbi:thioether cross-link-forming SCIFF peptide maturase [Bacillota bacterium Meth-B3]|nr:thioether cross-link-forming SCIFF peptide maturase [Christensenellaceae bacterium]MEA5065257.1 thioether cross-link-forming SCIFF peptide maturase [Eubacteriales bacterium]MEA5070141.1 thioether cross-link-forming SCIFF peptide maturase [Christensenellaceae bacterium]
MIHQYKLNGMNIVLDVNSGSVHLVDELAYDAIALYEEGDEAGVIKTLLERYGDRPGVDEAEIKETLNDIEELKAAGRLFAPDIYCDMPALKKKVGEVKALCLHVAHTCNLSCDYCFASQGKYHGERALMSFTVGKRALDFLMDSSGNRRNLEVDFFGGEPLMNFDVVKQLVAYARSVEGARGKRFRFTLTTNGVLLDDEVTDFLNREMHNVVLSLDGRKEVHDRLRKTANGQGSYDLVVPRFRRFVERRGQRGYYMRGTFTARNVDFTEDVLHMADLGFTQLSMEPVVCAPGEPYALTEADLPALCSQYERLAREMLAREKAGVGFTFYHYILDLKHGPCIHKRVAGCGSGTEYLAVTPWGDLYPCHQFVGDPAFLMGNVWDGVTNQALVNRFAGVNVFSREACRTCWARLYCSGGCAANSYHASGDIEGLYEYGCKLFKKRIECAIMMQAAKAVPSD